MPDYFDMHHVVVYLFILFTAAIASTVSVIIGIELRRIARARSEYAATEHGRDEL